MTPERWRQIGELFDAAVRIEPAEREAWLRAACGEDDDLRAEVGRLLAQDERADRDGFLTPPEVIEPASRSDGELAPPRTIAPGRAGPSRPIQPGPVRSTTPAGLHPEAAICRGGVATHRSSPGSAGAAAAARVADHLHPASWG